MFSLRFIGQVIIKNYVLLAFIEGYLLIYLFTVYHQNYFYKNDTAILPFIYNNRVRNVDSLLAENIKKQLNGTRILCWVMTKPKSYFTKAQHVKATWGSYCDILLFISSKKEDTLPVVALPVNEGYEHLWQKSKAAFYYIYENYYDKADWFLKADDDTYVVVENLRHLLSKHSPDSPIYFGRRFKIYVDQGYMSGGAGYVLSRKAVKLFIEKGLKSYSTDKCYLGTGGAEDANIGECLSYSGVKAGDSRDEKLLETFHPFPPSTHLTEGYLRKDNWIFEYSYYPNKEVGGFYFIKII